MQAIQERHENSLLKTEIDKLSEVNKALRMAMKKNIPSCPSCGFSSSSKEAAVVIPTQEQQLRIENARPKTEVIGKLISKSKLAILFSRSNNY